MAENNSQFGKKKLTDRQAMEENYSRGVIARCVADKGRKCFDFRDGLIAADPSEITMIHSEGNKYPDGTSRYSSRIVFMLSQGAKGAATSFSYNFAVNEIRAWCEAARAKLIPAAHNDVLTNANHLATVTQQLFESYQRMAQAQNPEALHILDVGCSMNNIAQSLRTISDSGDTWEMSNAKANPYKPIEGRTHPATGQQLYFTSGYIVRFNPVYNGKASNYPWYIKLFNGASPLIQDDTGKLNYKDIQDKVECFCNVSREDMFRMLDRVVRYIELWELCNIPNDLKNALQIRQELKAGAAQKSYF